MASAKIKINNIPTNNFSYLAIFLTPSSPTIPIVYPATKDEAPQHNPALKCLYPSVQVYLYKSIFLIKTTETIIP